MGNHLNGGAKVLSSALLVQNVPVDFAGGQIGILVQILINETLVVSQIKIGFCAVLCNIYLTMLIGAHGAGVHVDIGVQFLRGYFQSASLQQASKGGSGNSFSQSGYHAACDKKKLRHRDSLLLD